jgi:catechol 2,3-dioxygenase-like lactoylglutathione lyase family enzyme
VTDTSPNDTTSGEATSAETTSGEGTGLRFDGMVVFCADIAASARFYADGLGLQKDWSDDQHIAFHLPTAGNAHGGWLLLHPQTADQHAPHELGTFVVDDVDAVVQRLERAGYPIGQQPQDAPWGVREAWVTDVDGYGLILNAPLSS